MDVMNRCWAAPLVDTAAGGSHGGGARVTELGAEVLAAYRLLERALDEAAKQRLDALTRMLAPEPRLARNDQG